MFSSDKMENKNFLTVRNNSTVTIHGLGPGGTKKLRTDDKGVPLDYDWFKATRSAKPGGAIEIVAPKAKKRKASKSTSKGD